MNKVKMGLIFRNRKEAGKLLQKQVLNALKSRRELLNVIVALPRGGVPVAVEVASALQAPLTVLVSKKIGAPSQPEYAIGAVSSSGIVVLCQDNDFPRDLFSEHIDSECKRLGELTRKTELMWLRLSGREKQIDFSGKRAIIVDDGIATGMTIMAAAASLRQMAAAEIIIAAPVVAKQTIEMLLQYCDLVIAVQEPDDLGAVGCFYEDFHQVQDDEVKDALLHCAQHA